MAKLCNDTVLQIRVSVYLKNKAKMFAERYAKGNLSAWIKHGMIAAPRVRVNENGRPEKRTGPPATKRSRSA